MTMHVPDLIDMLEEIDGDIGNRVFVHIDCAIIGAELGGNGIKLLIDCHCEVDSDTCGSDGRIPSAGMACNILGIRVGYIRIFQRRS